MKHLFSKKNRKRGMTLLEIMLAFAIIAIVSLPVLNLFLSSSKTSASAGHLSEAAYAAQGLMEELISKEYEDIIDYRSSLGGSSLARFERGGVVMSLDLSPAGTNVFETENPVYAHIFFADEASDRYVAISSVGKLTRHIGKGGIDISALSLFPGVSADADRIVVIYASSRKVDDRISINAGDAYVLIYSGRGQNPVSITAAEEHYMELEGADFSTSLMKITINVYESESSDSPIVTLSDTVSVANPIS